ncbi:hypothetical protein TIFTF001_030617 [Ficus carica]|uniref:Uncharacterized protein n=1 Tax=Ficus carica TaxID=3494 RepID=A0AA88IZY8_FICCA|nr:hypothetical protein TIFTF001_030617 [Ficus carica]
MWSALHSHSTPGCLQKEAARSNGDTDGASVTGTPILKSAIALISKQRGRALARKSCPYLNRWANLLFIGIPCGLGCSSDPVGLNSECSGGHASADIGGGHRVNLTRWHSADSKRPRARAEYSSGLGSVARSGVAGLESDQLVVREGEEQYTGGGGRSIRFPGKGSVVAGEVLLGTVPGEGFSSCRGSSARVNTKGLDSGPLMVHDGEHRTNSIVVVQHSSRGRVIIVSSPGPGQIRLDPIRASHNRPVRRWLALVGIMVQGAAFLLHGLGTSGVLGLLEHNVFSGPARVPPMICLTLPSPLWLSTISCLTWSRPHLLQASDLPAASASASTNWNFITASASASASASA